MFKLNAIMASSLVVPETCSVSGRGDVTNFVSNVLIFAINYASDIFSMFNNSKFNFPYESIRVIKEYTVNQRRKLLY